MVFSTSHDLATNRNWTKWLAAAALAFLLLGSTACAETVDGFVTKIDSPTEFDIGTMHVVLPEDGECRVYISEYIERVYTSEYTQIPCDTQKIVISSHVRLAGEIRAGDGALMADELTLYSSVHRWGVRSKIEGGAILEESPHLYKCGQGWCGEMWIDGYPISITPKTKILLEPTGSNFGFGPSGGDNISAKVKQHSNSLPRVYTAAKLRENTCVVFHAKNTPKGKLAAAKLQFWPNWINAKEKKYDSRFAATVLLPDYSRGIPGTIQYQGAKPIVIIPNKAIQDWVTHLGNTLIPTYQKNLPDSDATKIHFHFYVVHVFPAQLGKYFVDVNDSFIPNYQILFWGRWSSAFYEKPPVNAMVRNTVVDPNGTIIIPGAELNSIQNTAQLATLLSVAIGSAIQKQQYNNWSAFLAHGFFNIYVGDDVGYDTVDGPWQTEQALRIGIRQMYLAGYDIREAPFAWAVAQGKPVQNPIINSKHPDQEIPWYAAYAFNYISHYYPDVDYSKLKRGEREYQQFLQELYKADPTLPRPQAQTQPASQPQSQAQSK